MIHDPDLFRIPAPPDHCDRDGGAGMPGQSGPGATMPPIPAHVLPGTGIGGSLQSVLQCRLQQIAMGHTPQSDAQLPLQFLLCQAMRYGTDARDLLSRPGMDPDHARYRRKLVQMAALTLAAIDRLDGATPGSGPGAAPSTQPSHQPEQGEYHG